MDVVITGQNLKVISGIAPGTLVLHEGDWYITSYYDGADMHCFSLESNEIECIEGYIEVEVYLHAEIVTRN